MNIYQKIMTVRVALQKANLKRNGKNTFAGFDYFTLDDFLPTLNELMLKNNLYSEFNIGTENATLTIINAEKPEETEIFSSPIAEAVIKGATAIQCLGGVHTYMKRYLYLNAFEIAEGDALDTLAGSDGLEAKGSYKPKKKVKQVEKEEPTVDNDKIRVGLLDECKTLGINLDGLLKYRSKANVEELTNDELSAAINAKRKALEKKKALEEQNSQEEQNTDLLGGKVNG